MDVFDEDEAGRFAGDQPWKVRLLAGAHEAILGFACRGDAEAYARFLRRSLVVAAVDVFWSND